MAGAATGVQLGDGGDSVGAAGPVAWCPVTGLLAVGSRAGPHLAHVHVTSVHCLQRHVKFVVRLEGEWDGLVAAAWSPAGCKRVLLTATRAGLVQAWQQPPYRHLQQLVVSDQPALPLTLHQRVVTLEDWSCQDVARLAGDSRQPGARAAADNGSSGGSPPHEQLLGIQWLQPAPPWSPCSSSAAQAGGDVASGTLLAMFARAAPSGGLAPPSDGSGEGAAADDAPPWVVEGTLAFVACLSTGKAVLGWARLWSHGQLRWTMTAAMPLLAAAAPPGTNGTMGAAQLLVADVTASADGCSILVACVHASDPGKVHAVQLRGNPMHLLCGVPPGGAAQLKLAVRHVAYAVIQGAGPGALRISSISWDPGSGGQRLLVVAAAAAAPHSDSAGGRQAGQLVLLSLQGTPAAADEAQLGGGTLVQLAAAPCEGLQLCDKPAWLLDGVVLWEVAPGARDGHRQHQLLLYDSELHPRLISLPGAGPAGECRVHAIAASPHGVAVAAVVSAQSAPPPSGSSSSTTRLVVVDVPLAPPPVPATSSPSAAAAADVAGAGQLLAGRVLWALVQHRHAWDVVQHVLRGVQQRMQQRGARPSTAGGGRGSSSAVAGLSEVAARVDSQVSCQAVLRGALRARWDALKLALLEGTPAPEARVMAVDLRLRKLAATLSQLGDALLRPEELKAHQQWALLAQQPQVAQGLAPPASGRAIAHPFLTALLDFEAACLKTWLARRTPAGASDGVGARAAAGAAPPPPPHMVPCIRHFLDAPALTAILSCYSSAQQMLAASLLQRQQQEGSSSCVGAKVLQALLQAGAERKQQVAAGNWEETPAGLVPGPFRLVLGESAAPPDALAALSSSPPEALLQALQAVEGWDTLPVLSDADITADATRLGLLPACTSAAKELLGQELRQHARFRRQLAADNGGALAAGAAPAVPGPWPARIDGAHVGRATAIKRSVWEQQLGGALGEPWAPGLVGSSSVVDLTHFVWLDTALPGLQSVDGAMLAVEGTPAQLLQPQPGHGRLPSKTALLAVVASWALACPITHEPWLSMAAPLPARARAGDNDDGGAAAASHGPLLKKQAVQE